MMTVEETVPSPSRIGVELMAIDEGAPLELDLRLESVSEGVLVTGTVSAPTTGECARCLTPDHRITSRSTSPSCSPIPTAPRRRPRRPTRWATSSDDSIDLEQPIIDAVGLALPFSPLCGPDCQGLCPHCGIPMATAEPGHGHEQIDPRWAKLTSMLDTDDK